MFSALLGELGHKYFFLFLFFSLLFWQMPSKQKIKCGIRKLKTGLKRKKKAFQSRGFFKENMVKVMKTSISQWMENIDFFLAPIAIRCIV